MTDRELLMRYAEAKDQQAFAQLVSRHLRMIYGSAQRQIPSGAEDITQAVFFLLAQRASSLKGTGSLAAWLFQATRFCCQNFRRKEQIRRKHEREAAMRQQIPQTSENPALQLTELLDGALAALRAGDRAAVLLRYLEGRSFDEMANELGISVDAAKKRATRGLDRLRDYFARRGYTAGGDSLAGMITASAAVVPPMDLEASVLGMAKAGTAAASFQGLAQGTAKMMAWAKIKLAAMIGAGLTTSAVIALAVAAAASGQSPTPASVPATIPAVAAAPARALTLEPPVVIPTPTQLAALMDASRARYRTVDLEYSITISDPESKYTQSADEIWRRTADREFHHAEIVAQEDGQTLTSNDTVVGTPAWSKKYNISSVNGPSGMVMRGPQLIQNTETNPIKVMEVRFGLVDAPVKWNEKTGFLEFETRLILGTKTGPNTFWAANRDAVEKVIIDPSRGFVPIRYERSKVDGTPTEVRIFEDYREVKKGLWVPWKVIDTWDAATRHEYAVKRIEVNGEIAPEKLDFAFPPEAQVTDQIADQVHAGGMQGIPEFARALAMTQPGSTIKANDGELSPRAAIGAETISGEVTKITAGPAQLGLGRVPAGQRIAQVLVVEPYGAKYPRDVKLIPSVDWIKATLDESRSSISRVRGNGDNFRDPELRMTEAQIADLLAPKWRLRYLVEATPPAMLGNAPISRENPPPYIEIQAGAKDKWVRVPVIVGILPAIEIQPPLLLLESGATDYQVLVHQNGPAGWKLKGFTAAIPGADVQSVTPESNGRLLIKIAVSKPGFVQGKITLDFEGESAPIDLPVAGLINK